MTKNMAIQKLTTILLSVSLTIASLTAINAQTARAAAESREYNLNFDAAKYVSQTASVDGRTVNFRASENIVYVRKPVDTKYQSLNFYVPEEYFNGKSIGNYTAATAPIFFPNYVGGYMPSEPGKPGQNRGSNEPNAILVALSKGCIVASPGARGRTAKNETGQFTGKAPAAIVDLKAAVRYLRLNDKAMPGNAERIISNGTSAGGALSALLGASGNSKDYEPFLQAIGAANARDDVYAVSSYCPITNLENADAAYEWQFNGVNDYKRLQINRMTDFRIERKEVEGTLTAQEIAVSGKLKPLFPAYLNSLKLKKEDGTILTLDAEGNGSFKQYVLSFLAASAQKAIDEGNDLSNLQWLTIKAKKVTAVDFDKYVRFARRMKVPPAFDGLDLKTGENELFGTATIPARHFTRFGKDNSLVGGSLADPQTVKLMNPMNHIGQKGVKTSKHWRIRHGIVDRDTSLAIPVMLAAKLKQNGASVNFVLPWNRGHGGDYDLNELFDWIAEVSK